ncbi:MAG: hypothetical protein A3J24_08060 [Deltaproteobacteria bacterium RIFCSPLOWO2_02_FULL_53_8]|nr:MAG: hypothetical protein A3J24_08060 [Deltaproteobacteria bacterium RIFCSPLOWO2_02_FULL_53_8]
MVIDGQAALLYGEPRLTRDIDVTVGVGPERLSDMLLLVEGLGLKTLTKDVESFVRRTMVLPVLDEITGIRVDFIFSFTVYEQEALTRTRGVVVRGQTVRFASLEDFIIHKVFAGRPRDMEDVRSALIRNNTFDRRYVRRWLSEFDALSEKGGTFLASFEAILKEIWTE